jgi:hypothetical protein
MPIHAINRISTTLRDCTKHQIWANQRLHPGQGTIGLHHRHGVFKEPQLTAPS